MRALSLLSTALLLLGAVFGGLACVSLAAPIRESFAHLQLPLSLAALVGVWKLLGAVALLLPGRPRLREGATLGFIYLFSGAAVLHLAAGDGLAGSLAPLVLLSAAVTRLALDRVAARAAGGAP